MRYPHDANGSPLHPEPIADGWRDVSDRAISARVWDAQKETSFAVRFDRVNETSVIVTDGSYDYEFSVDASSHAWRSVGLWQYTLLVAYQTCTQLGIVPPAPSP